MSRATPHASGLPHTAPSRTVTSLLLGVLVLAAGMLVPATPLPDGGSLDEVLLGTADARGSGHPYFNDRGALTWYRSWDAAAAAARAEGKMIFIEAGRKRCRQCMALCQNVLPHRHVRHRIGALCVGLVVHADRMESRLRRLFAMNLRHARMLPLVAFATPDGAWITGFDGGRNVRAFQGDMDLAEGARQRWLDAHGADADEVTSTPADPEHPMPPADPQDGPCSPPSPDLQPPVEPGSADPAPSDKDEAPQDPDEIHPDDRAPDLDDPTIRPGPAVPPDRGEEGPAEASGDPDQGLVGPDGRPPVVPVAADPARERKAREARDRGQWGTVLRLTRNDPELASLAQEARDWAERTLGISLRLMKLDRLDPARKALEAVASEFEGMPQGVDGERGLEALKALEEIRFLANPATVAATRAQNHERLRGSRWAALFAPPSR